MPPNFEENVKIVWDATQPLEVAQTLITRLNEANVSLDRLGQSGAFATISTQFGGLARGVETGLNAQLRITLGLLDQVTIAATLAAETVNRVNQRRSESVANLPVGRDPATGRFISLRDLQGTGTGGGGGGATGVPPFGGYPSDVTMLAQLQRYGYAQDYSAIQQAMGAPGPYAQRFQNILAGVPPGVTTNLGVGQFQGGYNAFANMPATMLGASVAGGGGGVPPTTYGVGQFAGGFSAFGGGGASAQQAAQAQQQLAQAATQASSVIQRQAGDVDLLNNRFARHITWILQGIVVWESFRVVAGIVREVYDQIVALEQASARLAFIQGGTGAQARQQLTAASLAGAQYGIGPIQSVQGAVIAAQTGATGGQQEQARQMALVFGAKEYENILNEVIQTQRRADAAGMAHVDVMGYIATAYAEVPGTIETYFDALQAGETVYKDLGVSAEDAGLIVAKVAYAMESSADAAANTVQTIFNRLRRPEIQAQLQQGYGIAAGPVPQMLRESTAALETLIQTGQDQRAQDLINLLAGGTINVQRIREAPLAFTAIGDAIRESGGELKKFNDLMDKVADTTPVKINQLTASWNLLLQALGNTSVAQVGFDYLRDRIDAATKALLTLSQGPTGEGFWTVVLNYVVKSVSPIPSVLIPDPFKVDRVDTGTLPQAHVGGASISQATTTAIRDLSQFTDELSQTHHPLAQMIADLDRLAMSLGKTERPLSELGGVSDLERAASQKGRYLQSLNGGGGFGGIQTLPEGSSFSAFASRVQGWQQSLESQLPPGTLKTQDFYFLDPVTRELHRLNASSEAIRFATEDMNKTLKAISGVFNLPAGGTAYVAFEALQAGFVPYDRLGQYGAGARGAGAGALETFGAAASGAASAWRAGATRGTGSGTVGTEGVTTPEYNVVRAQENAERQYQEWINRPAAPMTGLDIYHQSERAMTPIRPPVNPGTPGNVGPPINASFGIEIRNTILLDGKRIAEYLNSQYFKQLANLNRAGSMATV